jgi:hypothetical protein
VATPANEEALLTMAQAATASQLERICRGVRTMTKDPKDRVAERRVRERELETGLVRIEADLLPDEAVILMKAIERALAEMRAETGETGADPGVGNPGAADPRPTRPDALLRVAATYLGAAPDNAATEETVGAENVSAESEVAASKAEEKGA